MTTYIGNLETRITRFTFEGLRDLIVALIFISSFYVKIEPAPTDFLVMLAILMFTRSGVHFSRYFVAPLFFLIIFLVAGLISVIPIDTPSFRAGSSSPYQYFLGLAFTSVTGIFIAAYVAANPIRNYLKIEKAYWIAATLGSILGLLTYLQIEPFLYFSNNFGDNDLGTNLYRVHGGYKDPNVFSTWLVFPIISMMQAIMVGRLRASFISVASFLTMLIALLLAFSRGAWIDATGAAILMIGLSIVFAHSVQLKGRLILWSAVGILVFVIIIVGLLSVPSIQNAFQDRFVLVKSYDAGETGRFGNQLNSIPLLLGLPLGFGPYQFQEVFGEAPHNTFLNSFASGGWLGGLAYAMLFVTNVVIAVQVIFTRSKFQMIAIAIYATFLVMTLQGLQIDNEHWRHLYWLMGMGWGLFAAMKEQESGRVVLRSP